jgi:hypothetical protein
MAKQLPDKRYRTDVQKSKSRSDRALRAARGRRDKLWQRAASAAASNGTPINVAIHLTWGTLTGGDRLEGNVLSLPPATRDKRLWAALRLRAARSGVPFIAARAPEHSGQRGLHLHLVLHLPDSRALRDCMDVIEKLTGAPAAWIDLRGRSLRGAGRHHHGVIGMSACGGWLMQKHMAGAGGNGVKLTGYAAKSDGKAKVEGQHRLSHELSALARQVAA